ncbi:hypothetical protein DSM106972_092170 [Dulcicalothrix desertica PCC 7102]|uniref:PEP-CTERM protein-sorting domain-containing protein n=1 Tax=Dulcicalothrix desertica PCC 7102 TaxID=232991 RepID=A0A3S1ALP0_9CYAN|nr:hypothetical protein [Dulcicalothrix desertica]RUS94966.1 hypothetical protein DSM106972_092170 [Dulcicalothrix desertica PCC 7102]TWH62799.1 putative secreted protein with PEP-CTERM sorting signal [Dulcicalothrix desertica PCC 7102]
MINFKIWLTALLVISGAWVAFESGAKAQSSGSITIGNASIRQNGTISNDSTTNPIIRTNNTSVNSTNSNSNGGNIIVNAGIIYLNRVSIPEPSFVGGIFAIGIAAAVSRLKHKQK